MRYHGAALKKLPIFIVLLLPILMALLGVPAHSAEKTPERILSITPAGTEILYYLGLGDRVAGVTKYCNWPPEARSKPSIGDMMHINMEVVVSMRPDLVLISNMNEHTKGSLEAMGFPVAVVYQDDFNEICDSILSVGKACGITETAQKRVEELRESVRRISSKKRAGQKPRVLVVVSRDDEDFSFKKLYVAGKRSFYNDLLIESGASNAFEGDVPYAQLSLEGILRIDPDIIIELIGETGMENAKSKDALKQWENLRDLKAAREGKVSLIRGDFTLRAGPRYPLVLDAFSKIIHEGKREISESSTWTQEQKR
jgi:iron complex transport system substrate-binding protein